ncbi:phosphate signaling complex protein PhoU [Ruminococcaceae bacterium OttesenSCG-928-A16]|nr:phosphate signaling complex protein PhoU [Ruminococcaceae bacterium OttesenSCG-928-A16]
MRGRFDEQLDVLHTQMIEMGALCETAIACAIKGLLEGDAENATRAIAIDEEIDRMERDIETLCLKLLLQQQPVASDLRKISSALKMITDMERIGDQAADIAEITKLNNVKASDDTFTIREMSMAAIHMVTDSIDAYVRQDLELAHAVIAADDEVDNYFNEAKAQLAQLLGGNPNRAEYVIDALMIAKYLERIADHATNIAEWVVFSITGRHEGENDGHLPG